jgi:hypothetical protein
MEMTSPVWRKSSFSGGNNGDCVELANTGAVRDSKNPVGPHLRVELGTLRSAVKAGHLTR